MTKELSKPVFLKGTDSAKEQLEKLKVLETENKLTMEGQELLRENIKKSELGIEGEDNIAFQLRNSYMPMYVLQDVYLEDDETKTHGQIDFLVFTRKLCFVIESKYVTGKVSINRKARFTYSNNCTPKGCESPIAQNQRHINLIRQIRKGDESFKETYSSVIVFSNYEMVLDDIEAPDEVGETVIRADELISYIKDQYEKSEDWELSDEQLENWAKSFEHLCRSSKEDYFDKYKEYFLEPEDELTEIEKDELKKRLNAYRENRESQKKDEHGNWRVFDEDDIDELIKEMPTSMKKLKEVKGFGGGGKVAGRYGTDIIAIISAYKREIRRRI